MGQRTFIENYCDWCGYTPPEDAPPYFSISYSCDLNGYGYGVGTKEQLCKTCFDCTVQLRKEIINNSNSAPQKKETEI